MFFAFSGVGVLLSMAPLWFSSYVLQLRVPDVSLTVENIADFISAYIIGNLLQMAFRFWAFRRWVFPDEFGRNPDKAIESLTAGGIAEALEDARDPALLATATSRRCVAPPDGRGAWLSSAIPPSPGCRRLRDTAVSAPAPRAECRGTQGDPATRIR